MVLISIFLRRMIILKLHNRIVHTRHTDIMIKTCGGRRKNSATMKMAIEKKNERNLDGLTFECRRIALLQRKDTFRIL